MVLDAFFGSQSPKTLADTSWPHKLGLLEIFGCLSRTKFSHDFTDFSSLRAPWKLRLPFPNEILAELY